MVLLALQASFLMPPIGYALLMVRGVLREHVPSIALARRIAPFLAVQLAVLAAVLAAPALVHIAQPKAVAGAPTMSDEELRQKMREMLPAAPQP